MKISNRWIPILGFLLFSILKPSTAFPNLCQSDINSDGSVNAKDSIIMRSELGRDNCYTKPCKADLNSDGEVNEKDEEILQAEFGRNDCIAQLNVKTGLMSHEIDEEVDVDTKPLNPRFTDNGDGTVTDSETGLMWTKDANLPGDTMLLHQAFDYIDEINEGVLPNFGYTDWRLPTIEELRSLIDYTNFTPDGHVIVSGHPFENVQSLQFYSVSYLRNSPYSWFASLYCRLVGHNLDSCYGYVWPVRGKSHKRNTD